jgi:hypothetical protein
LAQDKVCGNVQNKAAQAPEKTKYKYSFFQFTLNSQFDFGEMSTDQKRQFKNLMDFIFAEKNIPKHFEDRTSPDDPAKNLAEVKSKWYLK